MIKKLNEMTIDELKEGINILTNIINSGISENARDYYTEQLAELNEQLDKINTVEEASAEKAEDEQVDPFLISKQEEIVPIESKEHNNMDSVCSSSDSIHTGETRKNIDTLKIMLELKKKYGG